MDSISKLHSNIKNAELADFAPKMSAWFEESSLSSDDILCAMMKSEKDLSSSILTAFKKSKVVSNLVSLDEKRDKEEISLFALLDGYASFPLEEKKMAAKKILSVIGKYRGLARHSLALQSTETNSMLEDLSNEELVSSINSLDGIGDLIERIKVAQNEFHQEEIRLVKEKSLLGESATVLRKKLFTLINEDIIPYLNIVSKYDDKYLDFVRKVATEISSTNTKILQRKSASKSEVKTTKE